MDSLRPAQGIDTNRLDDRRSLLQEVDQQQAHLARLSEARRLTDQQRLAFSILASGRIARAFQMDQEPAAVRDRYGRHPFGQSLLLARRLVQAGVPVVQANMGRVQNWDSHSDIFNRLKNNLLPPLDQGVSALLDDLEASGLLSDTVVMMLGEFGRTPRITRQNANDRPGRDHWAPCFFGVFAGGGVRGGQIIGRSDRIGAYPRPPLFAERHRRHRLPRPRHQPRQRGARPPESPGPTQPRLGHPAAIRLAATPQACDYGRRTEYPGGFAMEWTGDASPDAV